MLWINNRNGPQIRFCRNDVPSRNHYLAVRLEGRTCNRDAIGARVEVDRLSGRVKVVDLHHITAAGKVIYPAGYLGQIEGAAAILISIDGVSLPRTGVALRGSRYIADRKPYADALSPIDIY